MGSLLGLQHQHLQCLLAVVQPREERAEKLQGDLLAAYEYVSLRKMKIHFTWVCSDRTRGNGFKVKQGRFRLNIWKNFFMLSMVRHWHRLHRETVGAPIPKGNHGQVGIHEQPELIEGVPAHGRGVELGLRSFPTQALL